MDDMTSHEYYEWADAMDDVDPRSAAGLRALGNLALEQERVGRLGELSNLSCATDTLKQRSQQQRKVRCIMGPQALALACA